MTDPSAHPVGPDTTANLGRIAFPTSDEQAPRTALSPEEAAAIAALPRHSALLIVQRGPVFVLAQTAALHRRRIPRAG